MSQMIKSDVIALSPENAAALAAHPLLAVPAELRPAVYRLWKLHEFLFPTVGAITTAVAMDLDAGLDPADAAAVLAMMTQPDQRAKHRFAAEFMAELARMNALAIGKRRRDHEAKIRRENFAAEQEVAIRARDARVKDQRQEFDGLPTETSPLIGSLVDHFTAPKAQA